MKQALISTFVVATLTTLSLGLFSSPLLAAPGAHGPNGEHLDAPANANPGGLARLPDGSVNVPKLAQRRMEIRTQMVFQKDHTQTTELNGKVDIDPNAGGRVQAPFQGRVEPPAKGFPSLGQAVRKGDWKAVRLALGEPLELYDLSEDEAEKHNVATKHPEVVANFESYLKTARSPSRNWPVE